MHLQYKTRCTFQTYVSYRYNSTVSYLIHDPVLSLKSVCLYAGNQATNTSCYQVIFLLPNILIFINIFTHKHALFLLVYFIIICYITLFTQIYFFKLFMIILKLLCLCLTFNVFRLMSTKLISSSGHMSCIKFFLRVHTTTTRICPLLHDVLVYLKWFCASVCTSSALSHVVPHYRLFISFQPKLFLTFYSSTNFVELNSS